MKWRTNIFMTAVFLVTNRITIDGFALDCLYTMMPVPYIGSVYTCYGIALFDGNGNENENVTTVHGIHQTGKGYEDVHQINMHSQNLAFFPTNVEYFFPNVMAIAIYNNSITIISNRHLIPFLNLQLLSLWENKITSIDGDLFSGLDSMKYIDFGSNNITHVGHDLKLPINAEIHFTGNPCINQSAHTPDEVAELILNLLRNCPPIISQIEHSLERRQNLLTNIDGQIQALRTEQANLLDRMAYSESIIGNQLEPKPVDQFGKTN